MKKILSMTLGIALLAAAGTAYAATSDNSSSTSAGSSAPSAAAKPWGQGKGAKGLVKGVSVLDNAELLKVLGLDQTTLSQELASGKSLAAIAEAKGVSKDTLVSTLVAAATAQLDQQVKDGKITQAFADQEKTQLNDRMAKLVEQPGFGGQGAKGAGRDGQGSGKGGRHGGAFGGNLTDAAGILGLSVSDLQTQLQSGKSLAEIAQEKGISEDQLINSLLDKAKDKIKTYVERKHQAPAAGTPSAPSASPSASPVPTSSTSAS